MNMTNLKHLLIALVLTLPLVSISAQDNMEIGKRLYEQAEGKRWSEIKFDLAKEFQKAVPYLEKATADGFGEAAFMLAEIYYDNYCGSAKRHESFSLYQKAIDLGYDRGYVEMGKCYFYGRHGVDRDSKKAFELFTKGAENNEPEARLYIALCWFFGEGVEKADLNIAYTNCQNLVSKIVYNKDINLRYMWATFCLSDKFKTKDVEGQMVDQDFETGCELLYNTKRTDWMLAAAKTMFDKNIDSFYQRYYGNFRVSIYKIVSDITRQEDVYTHMIANACYMYAVFAERQDENCEDNDDEFIGEEESNNRNKYRGDPELKMSWGMTRIDALTRAAELGNKDAQKLLGDWYEIGHNVSKNLVRAKEWHEKAQKTDDK